MRLYRFDVGVGRKIDKLGSVNFVLSGIARLDSDAQVASILALMEKWVIIRPSHPNSCWWYKAKDGYAAMLGTASLLRLATPYSGRKMSGMSRVRRLA